MMAIAFAIFLSVSGSLSAAPLFDEAGAKNLYEGFVLQWVKPGNPEWMKPTSYETSAMVAFRELYRAHGPMPAVALWPVDPERGMLVNDVKVRPNAIRWEAEGISEPPDSAPASYEAAWAALYDTTFVAVTPKLCVPEACYFVSPIVSPRKKPVMKNPGLWIALRQHQGHWVIAGILIYRTAPKEPSLQPLFMTWKAELRTRFPLPAP